MAPAADAERALEELARGALRDAPRRAHEVFERAWPALERRLATFQRSLGVDAVSWEDCGQAALLRVWRARDAYRGTTPGELLAWLYRTCRNEHLRLVERARHPPDPSDPDDPDPHGSTTSAEDVTLAAVAARDARSALEDCLDALEPSQRQVVELLYSAPEPSEREVATMIDCSKSRVNQLRQAALAALERCLRRKGEEG